MPTLPSTINKILFFAAVYFPFLTAQNLYLDQSFEILDTSQAGSIYFYGAASLDGSIPSSFLNHFTKGDYIENEEIDQVLSKLGKKPNLHHHAKSGLFYHMGLDSLLKEKSRFNRMQLNVGLSYNNLSYTAFSPDAYELVFKGNHLDSVYDLSPLNFQYLSYFKLSAGFSFGVENSTLGIAISYYQSDDYFAVNSDQLALVNLENNSGLTTRGAFNYEQLDKKNNTPFVPQGFGAGIDLFFEQNINKNQKVSITVEDLAFIRYNRTKSSFSKDTLFQGIPTNGFNTDFENIEDSLEQWFLTPSKGALVYWIPTRLNLHYQYQLNEIPLKIHALVNYRAFPGYLPLLVLRAQYTHQIVQPYLQTGIGGWNNFQIGLGLELKWKKHQIALHLQNMEGLILPKNYLGTSVGITYRTIWNHDRKSKTSK